jgi:acetolactate synthase-1/2/3 large subunit
LIAASALDPSPSIVTTNKPLDLLLWLMHGCTDTDAALSTGPAATNALTPLLGAWQDSIPCMFISGQQRVGLTSYGKKVRQVGSQEAPILDIVRPIVKGAFFVDEIGKLREMLWLAYLRSIDGRKGPVWLDIPVDVTWANSTEYTNS